jgi:hypothetical protein
MTATAAKPSGWPSFLIGASYQGPAARSWRGDYWAWWADDLFDAQLVSDDFARAAAAGLNTLRVFVQLELLREIRDDNWTKLDTVMDLADQHGLRLILTLADYDEPRVATLARIDGAISARYANADDPGGAAGEGFWMLQSAMYPGDQKPPLQSRKLLERYGEQAANHFIVAFRASDEGQRGPLAIPERYSEDEAYVYHNNWIMSYKLSLEATDWSKKTGKSDLEFFSSSAAARWRPFLEALDATYKVWMEPRIEAIRKGNPNAVITMGHHDALIAALPSNALLDVISLHRYVPPGPDGLADQRQRIPMYGQRLFTQSGVTTELRSLGCAGEFGALPPDGEPARNLRCRHEETSTWIGFGGCMAARRRASQSGGIASTRRHRRGLGWRHRVPRMDGFARAIRHPRRHQIAQLFGLPGPRGLPARLFGAFAESGRTWLLIPSS